MACKSSLAQIFWQFSALSELHNFFCESGTKELSHNLEINNALVDAVHSC